MHVLTGVDRLKPHVDVGGRRRQVYDDLDVRIGKERFARVRRLELLHSFDFAETLYQPVRPLDKKSAAASLRKLRKACKEAHAEETGQ